jgi:hypothetical protein
MKSLDVMSSQSIALLSCSQVALAVWWHINFSIPCVIVNGAAFRCYADSKSIGGLEVRNIPHYNYTSPQYTQQPRHQPACSLHWEHVSSDSPDLNVKRGKYYETCNEVMIEDDCIEVLGTMGTGSTPEVNITVRPKLHKFQMFSLIIKSSPDYYYFLRF